MSTISPTSPIVKSSLPPVTVTPVDIFTYVKKKLMANPQDVVYASITSSTKAMNDNIQRTYTAEEVVRMTERVASALRKRGFQKGDSVCIFSKSCVDYIILCYATVALGGVFAPLYTDLHEHHLIHVLSKIQPKVLACSRDKLELGTIACESVNCIEHFIVLDTVPHSKWANVIHFSELVADDGAAFQHPPEDLDPVNDFAFRLNGGGSNGNPKGVAWTHSNFVTTATLALAMVYFDHLGNNFAPTTRRENVLATLPMAHFIGLRMSIVPTLKRDIVFIVGHYKMERDLARLLPLCDITRMFLSRRDMLIIIQGRLTPMPDFSGISTIFSSGNMVTSDMLSDFAIMTGFSRVQQFYGMAEVGLLSIISAEKSKCFEPTCGFLAPMFEGKIVDVDTRKDLRPTTYGELLIRGPILAFVDNPLATAAAFTHDGWFQTRDYARFDEEGYLYVNGPVESVIKHEGEIVDKVAIETTLLSHPDVSNAAVIAVAMENEEERVEPRAYVTLVKRESFVMRPVVTAAELEAFVSVRMKPVNQLRGGIRFVSEIPYTPIGKVCKPKLLKMPLIRN